ncbi:hypothetical protein ACFW04_013947 [Cataglyphis niger]
MIAVSDTDFGYMYTIRKHVIELHDAIDDRFCSNCSNSLYQIFPYKHINLLYVQDPLDDNVGHFAWIKNLSFLVSSHLSKHNSQKYICDRCLHYFGSKNKLQSHTVDCREINQCAIHLPNENDKWLKFNNYSRKERLPFTLTWSAF